LPLSVPLGQTRLLTTEEAAEVVRLSPRTLEDMRCNKTGPAYAKLGAGKRAKVLYKLSDLDAWVEANKKRP
jgi:excisionase family DNA binding protein